MIPLSTLSAGAWTALVWLATTNADRVVTLIVAMIGAVSSTATAVIATRARSDIRKRRTIVTKHEDGVTITDEELKELADGE